MSLKVYEVEINGHTTTVQLSDEDAQARGLTTANVAKSRSAANKSATPANKSGTAANKSGEGR